MFSVVQGFDQETGAVKSHDQNFAKKKIYIRWLQRPQIYSL